MIAANFKKYPEALRFQRELFSSGYKNQPRIMRLMTVIFDQRPSVPAWFTEARERAKALARLVRKACFDWVAEQISRQKLAQVFLRGVN